MCLVVLGLKVHPLYPLVVAANRDELLSRPSAPAAFWPGPGGLLAGRDLSAGGTWLGIAGTGRWALLTNVREPARHDPGAPSRGALVPGHAAAPVLTKPFRPTQLAEMVAQQGWSR